jgi:hypothetical protein
MGEVLIMEDFLQSYFREIVLGTFFTVLAWAFKSWADSLKEAISAARTMSSTILHKLDILVSDFHNHRVVTERRITRVETKLEQVATDVQPDHIEKH